jgi:excisionase family DNA binding protein
MEEGLMNINDLSEYIQTPISSIYGMVEAKEIPFIRIGRLIRFRFNEIESWLESKKVNPVPPEKEVKKIMKNSDLKNRPQKEG